MPFHGGIMRIGEFSRQYIFPISSKKVVYALLVLATICLLVIAYLVDIPAGDWLDGTRPGVLEFIAGRSPNSAPGFNKPPWAAIPLIPFAILPPRVGCAVLAVVTLASFAFAAIRLGAKPIALAFILLSPPVLLDLHHLNLEWMVVLGFVLPPSIGILFVLIKPQIGIVVAIFYLWEGWKKGGLKGLIKVSWPTMIILPLSLIIYGPWYKTFIGAELQSHNISMMPTSIPVGFVLIVSALKNLRKNHAMLASPFIAPYLPNYSLGVPLLGLLPSTAATIAGVIGLWILTFYAPISEIIGRILRF
jgi:hypothetical protein